MPLCTLRAQTTLAAATSGDESASAAAARTQMVSGLLFAFLINAVTRGVGIRSALALVVRSGCAHVSLPLLFLDARIGTIAYITLRCIHVCRVLDCRLILLAFCLCVRRESAVGAGASAARGSVLRVLRAVLMDAQERHHALRTVTLFVHANGTRYLGLSVFVCVCCVCVCVCVCVWLTVARADVSDALWTRLCGAVAEVPLVVCAPQPPATPTTTI